MRKTLNQFFKEFIIFTGKQARASIFGALLLFTIIITKWINFSHLPLSRYDAIFLIAIFFQFILIVTKAESKEEIKTPRSMPLLLGLSLKTGQGLFLI